MLLAPFDQFHVPNLVSLAIIVGTLAGGIAASLWAAWRELDRDGNSGVG
jgi:hypothetical protein